MRKISFLVAVAAVSALSACSAYKASVATYEFDKKTLELVELNGEAYDATAVEFPVVFNFSVNSDDSVDANDSASSSLVNGNSGCNRFFGSFYANADTLRFVNIGVTRMLCDNASNAVEQKVMDVINQTSRYEVNDSVVEFFNNEVSLAKFSAKDNDTETPKN